MPKRPNWRVLALTTFKPGQRVRRSGLFDELDRDGNPTGEQATCVRGEAFPPTSAPGYMWKLAQIARHKGDAAHDAAPSE